MTVRITEYFKIKKPHYLFLCTIMIIVLCLSLASGISFVALSYINPDMDYAAEGLLAPIPIVITTAIVLIYSKVTRRRLGLMFALSCNIYVLLAFHIVAGAFWALIMVLSYQAVSISGLVLVLLGVVYVVATNYRDIHNRSIDVGLYGTIGTTIAKPINMRPLYVIALGLPLVLIVAWIGLSVAGISGLFEDYDRRTSYLWALCGLAVAYIIIFAINKKRAVVDKKPVFDEMD